MRTMLVNLIEFREIWKIYIFGILANVKDQFYKFIIKKWEQHSELGRERTRSIIQIEMRENKS